MGSLLTRVLLGYFHNASYWGGGTFLLPMISQTSEPILKITTPWKPWKNCRTKTNSVNFRVTNDVTGQVKDKMFAIFTEVPADDFVARNGDLRRKQ